MSKENKQINYRIPVFCLATILFWFAMYTYVPILGVYTTKLGASNKMTGIIVGSYGFVQMILRIPLGIASDKLHKRKLFINFGLFFTFFSGIGLWIFKDLSLILVFRALAGASAATWVDFTVLFTSYYKQEEATKAIGILNFYNYIAQMLAMLSGGFLAEKISFESTFLLGAAVGIIGLIASLFIAENYEEKGKKITLKGVVEVVQDRTLLSVSFLAVISQLIAFATVFGFTPIFAQSLGATKFDMSLLTVFSNLPSAFASLIGGTYLSKKFGEKKVIVAGFIVMGIFTITIPFTKNLWLLMITQALSGVGRGFSFPLLMGMSIQHMEMEKRATAMGFFQSIYGLGMFLGPVIIGVISDVMNLKQGFILFGILGCITSFIAFYIIKKEKEGFLNKCRI